MEQLARLASQIGNVSAIWIENRPDLVEGYISAIKRDTNHSVELHIATNHAKAQDMMEGVDPSGLILDIKLSDNVDGITIAKRIRQRNKVIPIKFVTSYLDEYKRRLKEVDNLGGVYDRLSLKDDLFHIFQKSLTSEMFAYKVYVHFDLGNMTWSEYLRHPHADDMARAHSYLFTRMARTVMAAKGWNWMAICGDRPVAGGKSLERFPSFEDKKRLATKYGGIPFVYSRPIISEEGGGIGALLDHYPKAIMRVDGKQALADIDTGTNQTLVSDQVADREPGSVPERSSHLGKDFEYYVNMRSVVLQSLDESKPSVGPFSMPIAIIDDWKASPWIRINPRRAGLIGRDIFAMESLSMQIDSTAGRKGVSTKIQLAQKRTRKVKESLKKKKVARRSSAKKLK